MSRHLPNIGDIVLAACVLTGAMCFPVLVGHGALVWYDVPYWLAGIEIKEPMQGLAASVVTLVGFIGAMSFTFRLACCKACSAWRLAAAMCWAVSAFMMCWGSMVDSQFWAFLLTETTWFGPTWCAFLAASIGRILFGYAPRGLHCLKSAESGRKASCRCRECGYDLRALASEQCPECGCPIASRR